MASENEIEWMQTNESERVGKRKGGGTMPTMYWCDDEIVRRELFDGRKCGCASVVTEYVPTDRRVSGCVCVCAMPAMHQCCDKSNNQSISHIYICVNIKII